MHSFSVDGMALIAPALVTAEPVKAWFPAAGGGGGVVKRAGPAGIRRPEQTAAGRNLKRPTDQRSSRVQTRSTSACAVGEQERINFRGTDGYISGELMRL